MMYVSLTKILESKLDGTYTQMLRAVLNLSWRQYPIKQMLYGSIPLIEYGIFLLSLFMKV